MTPKANRYRIPSICLSLALLLLATAKQGDILSIIFELTHIKKRKRPYTDKTGYSHCKDSDHEAEDQ